MKHETTHIAVRDLKWGPLTCRQPSRLISPSHYQCTQIAPHLSWQRAGNFSLSSFFVSLLNSSQWQTLHFNVILLSLSYSTAKKKRDSVHWQRISETPVSSGLPDAWKVGATVWICFWIYISQRCLNRWSFFTLSVDNRQRAGIQAVTRVGCPF